MPPELLRRFEVAFKPPSKAQAIPMRHIGAAHVGKLVSVKVSGHEAFVPQFITDSTFVPTQGICTHVTDVKPHIIVATYTDAETGYEVYQHVTGMILSSLQYINLWVEFLLALQTTIGCDCHA